MAQLIRRPVGLMSNFRQFDRATGFLLPPSLDEWLPERHLARFVVEVIDGLDLSAMVKSYRGSGSAGYHPALLLGLLVYGYTTGVFSSRKLATWKRLMPVALPPGRARLATRPSLTGSSPTPNTIGIVAVAALAAIASDTVIASITATRRRTKSAIYRQATLRDTPMDHVGASACKEMHFDACDRYQPQREHYVELWNRSTKTHADPSSEFDLEPRSGIVVGHGRFLCCFVRMASGKRHHGDQPLERRVWRIHDSWHPAAE